MEIFVNVNEVVNFTGFLYLQKKCWALYDAHKKLGFAAYDGKAFAKQKDS